MASYWWLLPLCASLAFGQNTKEDRSDCSCDVYADLLKTSCTVLENNFGMDCSACDCDVSEANNNRSSAGAQEECSSTALLYASLIFNGVTAFLIFVSELMGSSDKVSVNGIIHAFLVASGRRKPFSRKEVELTTAASDTPREN